MHKQIPPEIDNDKNRAVLSFVEPMSCHGDIVEPLRKCLAEYEDALSFCPAPKNFKYIIWYVEDVVFAFATGMQEIGLRIDSSFKTNGQRHQQLEGWVAFPYDSNELCGNVRYAYNLAKSIGQTP